MLQRQVAEYNAAEASQKISVSHSFRANPLYRLLVGKVSRYAISLIEKQRVLAVNATTGEALPDCRGAFKHSMGLPCAHEIQGMAHGEPIVLSAIAAH